MSILNETLVALAKARESSDSVCVMYSDGKDSRAVLDLCSRTFARVEAVFMEMIPGLACIEDGLRWADKNYGVKVRRVPHWILPRALREGVFCHPWHTRDSLPEWTLRQVYDLASAETGCKVLASGAKKADSRWRKWNLAQTSTYQDVLYPVLGWSKLDVLAYLQQRGIYAPDSSSGNATGVDLSTPSILWLHDRHPEDYRKLLEVFPLAEAIVWRRKFYGNGSRKTA